MPRVQYELIPAGDNDKAQEQLEKRLRYNRVKKILFHLLALLAIMFAGYKGLTTYIRSSARWLHKLPCHGLQRNLTTLPSHYTLPSGHEIPSVALGTGAVSFEGPDC